MSAAVPRLGWASRGTLSGVCCSLPVDGSLLAEHLAQFGPLRIDPPPGAEPTVICELWIVREGRALAGGFDLGEEAERWIRAGAGLSGWLLGAGMGWVSRMASGRPWNGDAGHRSGAGAGSERMSALAGRQVRDVVRAISLRPYHELMLAVPDVCIDDDPTRHMAVLDMVTDSSLSIAIDRGFTYGYRKRIGAIDVSDPGAWSVSVDGGAGVEARLSEAPAVATDADRVNEWWTQPFLAGLRDGNWRRSHLERRIDHRETGWASLTGSISGLNELGAFALDGEYLLGTQQPHGAAVAFHDVNTRISYPRPVGR